MTFLDPPIIGFRTLADRMADGRMPVSEALRHAVLLGQALREIHQSGKIHGAVSTESVLLAGEGIVLTPASANLESQAAGVSTDILGFGVVLYEMLTGRKISTPEAPAVLEPSGIPAADRLITRCLAKEPPARLLSMQKVLLELKLITMVARRAEPSVTMHRDAAEVALQAEMRDIEARLTARLEEQEKSVAARQQSVSDLLNTLRPEFVTLRQLSAAHEALEANAARLTALEQGIDAIRQNNTAVVGSLAKDIDEVKKSIETHATTIESIRMSTAEIEDMVQRLVEAMETIQESVLDLVNGKS